MVSKSFKSYIGQYSVISLSLVWPMKASIVCNQVMKKHFNKELVMTKENDENFESCMKCF